MGGCIDQPLWNPSLEHLNWNLRDLISDLMFLLFTLLLFVLFCSQWTLSQSALHQREREREACRFLCVTVRESERGKERLGERHVDSCVFVWASNMGSDWGRESALGCVECLECWGFWLQFALTEGGGREWEEKEDRARRLGGKEGEDKGETL